MGFLSPIEKLNSEREEETNLTGNYRKDLKNKDIADFFTAAGLGIKIEQSQKQEKGRTPEDAEKFGVGLYKGAFPTFQRIQDKMDEKVKYKYNHVENELRKGSKKEKDIADYIEEVVTHGE